MPDPQTPPIDDSKKTSEESQTPSDSSPFYPKPKTTKARFIRRVFFTFSGLAACAACLLFAYRIPILQGAAEALVYEDAPQKADVIYVLGGGGYLRIEKAIQLYQQGYSQSILVALPKEIRDDAADRDVINVESLQCQALLKRRHIPAEHAHWSQKPFYSTYSEISYLKSWLNENNKHSAIVITGLFQSQRAKWTVDHFFFEKKFSICVIPAEGRFSAVNDWWKHEESFITVENEIIKNGYYALKRLVSDPESAQTPGDSNGGESE